MQTNAVYSKHFVGNLNTYLLISPLIYFFAIPIPNPSSDSSGSAFAVRCHIFAISLFCIQRYLQFVRAFCQISVSSAYNKHCAIDRNHLLNRRLISPVEYGEKCLLNASGIPPLAAPRAGRRYFFMRHRLGHGAC